MFLSNKMEMFLKCEHFFLPFHSSESWRQKGDIILLCGADRAGRVLSSVPTLRRGMRM